MSASPEVSQTDEVQELGRPAVGPVLDMVRTSFSFNLYLLPAVLAGTVIGRWLLWRIDQGLFENLVLVLSAVARLLLVW